MRHSLRLFANAALVVTSLIVAILIFELGLRMIGYPAPVPNPPTTGSAPRFYYEADTVNGHDISKNFSDGVFLLPDYMHTYGSPFTVSSNSLGCRDRLFDHEHGYVLLLGDSFTWGYVALEQTWGATLEQLIGARVLKCGVGGYGTHQERHKLKAIVRQAERPRLVVVGYNQHDLLDDYLYPGRTVVDGYMVTRIALADSKRGDRKIYTDDEIQGRLKRILEKKPSGFAAGVKDYLSSHSIVYEHLRKPEVLRRMAVRLGFADPPHSVGDLVVFGSLAEFPWLERAWKDHLDNLRQLKLEVDSLGATLLVVMFPDRAQIYESLRPQNESLHWDYPYQHVTEFLRREHIAFVDLLPEFMRYVRCMGSSMSNTQEDLYYAHDGHPSVKGNRLAGLLIGRQVLEQQLLGAGDYNGRLSDVNQLLSVEGRCRRD
jgi:hypothetical protein